MTFEEMVSKIKEQAQKEKEAVQSTINNIVCVFQKPKS